MDGQSEGNDQQDNTATAVEEKVEETVERTTERSVEPTQADGNTSEG